MPYTSTEQLIKDIVNGKQDNDQKILEQDTSTCQFMSELLLEEQPFSEDAFNEQVDTEELNLSIQEKYEKQMGQEEATKSYTADLLDVSFLCSFRKQLHVRYSDISVIYRNQLRTNNRTKLSTGLGLKSLTFLKQKTQEE